LSHVGAAVEQARAERIAAAVAQALRAAPAGAQQPRADTVRGPGCRSVRWFGTVYEFTERQGEALGVLWDAWEQGTPDVGQKEVLATIEANSQRLSDLFADHAAWGTMIRPGATRGTYRLTPPEE
jgi:hypothetical protein